MPLNNMLADRRLPSGEVRSDPGRAGLPSDPTERDSAPVAVPRAALAILASAAAVRLLLAALVPLVPDEAYYWEWSRHLAGGYFDHPPAIAWLVRAGTLLGGTTPLGVRLAIVAVGFLGCFAAVALAHRLAGARAATRAAVLMSVTPLAGIGLVLATPDVPMLAGTAATLWALDHIWAGRGRATADIAPQAGRPSRQSTPAHGTTLQGTTVQGTTVQNARAWWVAAGAFLGLSLLSKYPVVLVPAGIALACVLSPPLRPWLRQAGPYLATLLAAVLFAPVVWWNARHGWVSFLFQIRHGLGPLRGSVLDREVALFGAQLGLVTPILFVFLVLAVATALRRPARPRAFVLATLATFIMGFFVLSAVRHPVSPNWPVLALLPAMVLLATASPGPIRARWELAGVALAAVVVIALSVHAVHPWLPLAPRQDPFAQAYGWDELARAVVADDDRIDPVGTRVWIAADRYQEAAELAWELPGHPAVFSLELASRRNEYDFWPTAADSVRVGDAVTLVLDETRDDPTPVRRLAPLFSQVVRGALVEMHWGAGRVVARRRIWHFLGLTTPLSATLGRPSS